MERECQDGDGRVRPIDDSGLVSSLDCMSSPHPLPLIHARFNVFPQHIGGLMGRQQAVNSNERKSVFACATYGTCISGKFSHRKILELQQQQDPRLPIGTHSTPETSSAASFSQGDHNFAQPRAKGIAGEESCHDEEAVTFIGMSRFPSLPVFPCTMEDSNLATSKVVVNNISTT